MKSEEEEEDHREDVRKLVEMMQKEEEQEQEEQRDRVAPNMGAGGSHPQAMSVPERKETRGMRWADCEDDERQEEEGERERQTRQCHANTLHLVIHLPTTTTPTTTAAAAMRGYSSNRIHPREIRGL